MLTRIIIILAPWLFILAVTLDAMGLMTVILPGW